MFHGKHRAGSVHANVSRGTYESPGRWRRLRNSEEGPLGRDADPPGESCGTLGDLLQDLQGGGRREQHGPRCIRVRQTRRPASGRRRRPAARRSRPCRRPPAGERRTRRRPRARRATGPRPRQRRRDQRASRAIASARVSITSASRPSSATADRTNADPLRPSRRRAPRSGRCAKRPGAARAHRRQSRGRQ